MNFVQAFGTAASTGRAGGLSGEGRPPGQMPRMERSAGVGGRGRRGCREGMAGEPAGIRDSLGANQCFHCLITFPNKKFKERHMKREHPEDFIQANLRDALFLCFVCNKAFKSSRALVCHQRGHALPSLSDGSGCLGPTFDCPDCGRRFGQLANYQSHRLGHAAGHSSPYQCPECGKVFQQLGHLRQHQDSHRQAQELLPSRPYSCKECGESFSHEAGLHEHYIRHARRELSRGALAVALANPSAS